MDGGSFYRRGSLITFSLAGSSPYTSTPTSAAGYMTSAPVDTCDPTLHQKVNQLLFLFNEERREVAGLKVTVLELKEQVEEMKEKQKTVSFAEVQSTAAVKGSYRVPTDISV